MNDLDERPRRPRRRLVAIVIMASLGAIAVVAALIWRPDAATVAARGDGRRAATFAVPDLRDPAGTIELAAFAGRPVVLNFWASWCVPCRREMPAFQAVSQRLGDRVAFIGINHQDSRDDALELLADTGVSYPAGYDPEGKIARAYRLFGMPTTVFITADGRIAGQHTGELNEAELEDAIDQLLGPAQ